MSELEVDRLLHQLSDHNSMTSLFTRKKAAEKLGQLKDPKATEPLIKALDDETWPVTAAAAEALAAIGNRKAVPYLIARLKVGGKITLGEEKAVIKALGILQDVRALKILILLLKEQSKVREKMGANYFGNLDVILTALQQITKSNLGEDPSEWDRWWCETNPS